MRRECPNKHRSAHREKLVLTWSGCCADCGRQITQPPVRPRLSGALARAATVARYNGGPE